jgi:hypothetical protein
MTETAREPNEAPSRDVTVAKDSEQGKDATTTDEAKSSSPSKDKRSSAPESETPAKSGKKRRKVNHGMAFMSYTQVDSTALLTRDSTSSVHILQTFGELPPQHPIHCIMLRPKYTGMTAD